MKRIDRIEAVRNIKEYIQKIPRLPVSLELMLLEERTIEKLDYFVFFYDSKPFIETGKVEYILPGIAPLIFDRYTGQIYQGSSRLTVAENIDIYKKKKVKV